MHNLVGSTAPPREPLPPEDTPFVANANAERRIELPTLYDGVDPGSTLRGEDTHMDVTLTMGKDTNQVLVTFSVPGVDAQLDMRKTMKPNISVIMHAVRHAWPHRHIGGYLAVAQTIVYRAVELAVLAALACSRFAAGLDAPPSEGSTMTLTSTSNPETVFPANLVAPPPGYRPRLQMELAASPGARRDDDIHT